MNRVSSLSRQLMTCCLVTLLAAPAGIAQQSQASSSQAPVPATSQSTPGAVQGNASQSGVQPQQGAPASATSASDPQSPAQQQPLGSAAAPYEKGIGVGVSRPAGAAIAPAKQRRTRSFVIKTAVVIGAAVAVGTVIGLSVSSPSRPN